MNLNIYILLILIPIPFFNGLKVQRFEIESTFKGDHVANVIFSKDGKFETREIFEKIQTPNCVGTSPKKDTKKIFRSLKITLKEVLLVPVQKSQIRDNPAFIELYSEDQFWMEITLATWSPLKVDSISNL